MIRKEFGGHGGEIHRQPRATRTEMSRRRKMVLEQLSSGPASIGDIFTDIDLTYSQAIGLLKIMESHGDIHKIGKDGREVIYSLTPKQNPFDQFYVGENPRVIGMYEYDDTIRIDLKLPSGQVLHTQLLAS